MTEESRHSARDCASFGLAAGVLFAIVEVAAAAMMGDSPLLPIRMFASILLGREALTMAPLGIGFAVGVGVHLALSAAFGYVYGLLNGRRPLETHTDRGKQAVSGLAFGVALWFVNFQIVARIAYPWFLDAPQLLQAALHALAFGLPLALLYAGGERRIHGLGGGVTPAPAA